MNLFNNKSCTCKSCTISCKDVNSCINTQLTRISSGNYSTLSDFCDAAVYCVNTQFGLFSENITNNITNFGPAVEQFLQNALNYTNTGDIFLTYSDGVLTWQSDIQNSMDANNGLSLLNDTVQLGQSINEAGNPAILLSNREIPMNNNYISFNNKGSSAPSYAAIEIYGNQLSNNGFPGIVIKTSLYSSINHIFQVPATTTVRNFGNVNWYGTTTVSGDRYLGASGYHYQDFGGGVGLHYFIFDMTGTPTSYISIECSGSFYGNSHCNWVNDGSTQFGLAGNQKTIFGIATAASNIRGFVHIRNNTSSTASFHIAPSTTTPSTLYDGNIWVDDTVDHIYCRLNGSTIQLDNDNIHISAPPASASATGTTGTITWDTDYVYVCTATNTWKRAALSTW